jgi:uncharacterized protein YaaQ
MNPDTVTLIDRPYQEIVDDLLTAIVGGVVNEPIIYDAKETLYPLAQPASDVRTITGTVKVDVVNGEPQLLHRAFEKTKDFVFDSARNAVSWMPVPKGTNPADETIFYVDYFRPPESSRSPLSDINVGSVTRTLSEAIGREIATVYQQINQAYLAGFIDTATGQALDLVVAILGVKRRTKDFPTGLVTFFRDPAVADGNITVPEAILLSTEKGEASFVTVEERTLQRGQVRIDVRVRATIATDAGLVAAGAITTLAQPMTGIVRVTNFDATVRAADGETDVQLRDRAKTVLRGLGNATIAALLRVIAEEGAEVKEITDPNSGNGKTADPGTVTILVNVEAARFPSLQAAVNQTRAAGVQTNVVAPFIFMTPQISATIPPGVPDVGKDKIKDNIIAAAQSYVDALPSGAPADAGEMLKSIGKPTVKTIAAALTGVTGFKIVNVMASQADIGSSKADPLVEALLTAVQGVTSSDLEALRSAIKEVIDSEAPALLPSGGRIPKRDVIKGIGSDGKATEQLATDGEIASAKFQVVPPEGFSVALDMHRADIVFT